MTTLLSKIHSTRASIFSLKISFDEAMETIQTASENENLDHLLQGVCAIVHSGIDLLPVSSIALAKLFCDAYNVPDSLIKAFAVVESYIDLQREYTDLHMQLLSNKRIRRVK